VTYKLKNGYTLTDEEIKRTSEILESGTWEGTLTDVKIRNLATQSNKQANTLVYRDKRVYTPTASPADWRALLADPEKHWRAGYSAMATARSWDGNAPGFPREVRDALNGAHVPALDDLELLLAIPEHKTPLPGGRRPSQTDVFVLARNDKGLVAIAVEGKVDESFGPTLGQKLVAASPGVLERVAFLKEKLQLPETVSSTIRYQLMHRTVSALLIADEFHASTAVMLVHSFSQTDNHFNDYCSFLELFGKAGKVNEVTSVGAFGGTELFLGWVRGDEQYLSE